MSDQHTAANSSTIPVKLDECGLVNSEAAATLYISTEGTNPDGTRRVLSESEAKSLVSRCLARLTDDRLSSLSIPEARSHKVKVSRFSCPELHELIRTANSEALQDPSELVVSSALDSGLTGKPLIIVDVTGSHSFQKMRAPNGPPTQPYLKDLPTKPMSADDRCVKLAPSNSIELGSTVTGALSVPMILKLAGTGLRYPSSELREELQNRLSERLNRSDEVLNHQQRMATFFGDHYMDVLASQIRNSINRDLETLGITSASMREGERFVAGDNRTFEVESEYLKREPLTQDNVGDKCRLLIKNDLRGRHWADETKAFAEDLGETMIKHTVTSEKLTGLSLEDLEELLCDTANMVLFDSFVEELTDTAFAEAQMVRIKDIMNNIETVKIKDMPEDLDYRDADNFGYNEDNFDSEPNPEAATHLRFQGRTWMEDHVGAAFVPLRSSKSRADF